MTENLCSVVDSKFINFSSQTNGGAIYLNQTKELQVFRCFFVRCSTNESYYGGGIYFESSKNLITVRNCASECVSNVGFFIFVQGAVDANVNINETMTTNCSGEEHTVCFIQTSDLYSRMYNSSFCYSKIHHNFESYHNKVTNSMFHQYYKNNQDIVYGANSDGENHRLSHACLIMNGRSNGRFGYIHTNWYNNEVLTVNDLYAYGNDDVVAIASPLQGKIVINNFTGDKPLTYTGSGQFVTDNVIINSSFVMTTLFKNILLCEVNAKCTLKINQNVNFISVVPFLSYFMNFMSTA
jgi:hypothetical protein